MTLMAPPAGQGMPSPALLHNGLASHAQEWQRELDRAQARAWLHATPGTGVEAAGVSPGDGGSPGAAVTPGVAATSACGLPAGSVALPSAATHSVGQGNPLVAQRCNADVAAGIVPPASTPAAAGPAGAAASPTVRIATARAEPEPPARTPAPLRPCADATPQIHVHLEEDASGLRVWLGVPGDEAAVAARAGAVLGELRRALGPDSQRLLAVTCNGHPLMDTSPPPSSPPEDSPWPLDP